MRVIILFIFLTLAACTTSVEKPLPNDKAKKIETINNLMNDWHKSAANADLSNYIGAMDSHAIYIGTDATENWSREEFATFCKPYFDKKTTWDFTPLERNIFLSLTGKSAWFDEILKTHMGTCRGSGALEIINGEWKIKHYVLSMAIPNDATDAVKAAKKQYDDAFLKLFE